MLRELGGCSRNTVRSPILPSGRRISESLAEQRSTGAVADCSWRAFGSG